jgi:hypothetical protein
MRALLAIAIAASGCYIRQEVDNCVAETCNGIDDDCDDQIDEGFDLGQPCDGEDSDACEDGTTVCGGGSVICSDVGEEHPDLCDGSTDEDCDPTTPDGSAEPSFGAPCDGPDADTCGDGSTVCVGGELVCNDLTPDNVEVCNGTDDDCDTMIDEGFDLSIDMANCGSCGNACTNAHGTTTCDQGACVYTCDLGALDCNGDPDDGCEILYAGGATCDAAIDLGTVGGDDISEFVEHTGTSEGLFVLYLAETSSDETDVTALVELETPPGLNYDLYVSCDSCGGAIMGSSTNPAGQPDAVDYRKYDTYNVDDTRLVYIDVRYIDGTACGDYTLRVTGRPPDPIPVATCP